ncbi:MAG: GxxExxY protein [Pyrinomonadaceae bacterium]
MHENDIARIIVDAAFKIHTQLGPGLLESVYEKVLAYELTKRGLNVVIQQAIPVVYEEVHLEMGFRAGLIVNSYRRSEIGGGDRSGSCKAASHIFTIDRSTARPIDQF